jgi:hypothetical protein
MKSTSSKLYDPADMRVAPAASMTWFARFGLNMLVVFNVIAQAIAVCVFIMGSQGTQVAPIAGGAVVALFMLMYFYGRWMFPILKRRHTLYVLLLKELAILVLFGLAVGLVVLVRWIIG